MVEIVKKGDKSKAIKKFKCKDCKTVFLTTSCGSLLVPRKIGKGVKTSDNVYFCKSFIIVNKLHTKLGSLEYSFVSGVTLAPSKQGSTSLPKT